jgi:hypothetical protein
MSILWAKAHRPPFLLYNFKADDSRELAVSYSYGACNNTDTTLLAIKYIAVATIVQCLSVHFTQVPELGPTSFEEIAAQASVSDRED